MSRTVARFGFLIFCGLAPVACQRSDRAEADRLRAELEESKARERNLQARLNGGPSEKGGAPAQGSVLAGGTATFADGKTRRFVKLKGFQAGFEAVRDVTRAPASPESDILSVQLFDGGIQRVPLANVVRLEYLPSQWDGAKHLAESGVEVTFRDGTTQKGEKCSEARVLVFWPDGQGDTQYTALNGGSLKLVLAVD